MLRLATTIPLCILIVLCLGCETTNKYVGKEIHPNYYICHCQTFPAQGYQSEKWFIYNYKITKLETKKYSIAGTAQYTPAENKLKDLVEIDRLQLDFGLIKDNVIADTVRIITSGDPSHKLVFKKFFSTEIAFDGITIIDRYVSGYH